MSQFGHIVMVNRPYTWSIMWCIFFKIQIALRHGLNADLNSYKIMLFLRRFISWNLIFYFEITSNARPRTRSALSRRDDASELSANYLFIKFQKTNIRFEFFDPDYPSVDPYRKISFTSLHNSWTNRWVADIQAITQTIYFFKTLLYKKEKNIDSHCDFSAQVFLRTRLVRQIRWNRNVKKTYWPKSRPNITFLDWITGQRNLIGWIAPLLKSYWLKP
jgi:hypothetical protein